MSPYIGPNFNNNISTASRTTPYLARFRAIPATSAGRLCRISTLTRSAISSRDSCTEFKRILVFWEIFLQKIFHIAESTAFSVYAFGVHFTCKVPMTAIFFFFFYFGKFFYSIISYPVLFPKSLVFQVLHPQSVRLKLHPPYHEFENRLCR